MRPIKSISAHKSLPSVSSSSFTFVPGRPPRRTSSSFGATILVVNGNVPVAAAAAAAAAAVAVAAAVDQGVPGTIDWQGRMFGGSASVCSYQAGWRVGGGGGRNGWRTGRRERVAAGWKNGRYPRHKLHAHMLRLSFELAAFSCPAANAPFVDAATSAADTAGRRGRQYGDCTVKQSIIAGRSSATGRSIVSRNSVKLHKRSRAAIV